MNSRKGYYPEDVANTFGVPVEQHRADTEFHQMDGYVSVGVLTGKMPSQEECQGTGDDETPAEGRQTEDRHTKDSQTKQNPQKPPKLEIGIFQKETGSRAGEVHPFEEAGM